MSSGFELPQFPENDPRWLTSVPCDVRVTKADFTEFTDQLSNSVATVLPFRHTVSKQYDAFFVPEDQSGGRPIIEVKSFERKRSYTVHGHVVTQEQFGEVPPLQREHDMPSKGRAAILRTTVSTRGFTSRWAHEIDAGIMTYPYITSTLYDSNFTHGPWFANEIPPMGGISQLRFGSARND